jgi:glycosyltransferase involved in cell wall biosynthesis
MEAATQKLAILSTDFAGVPEFIAHGVEGLLAPPGDVAALARSLERLIVAPDLRARLGTAAHAAVHGRFSFEAGIAQIADRLRAELAGAGR